MSPAVLRLRPALLRGEGSAGPCLHIGEPRPRADRAVGAFRLAQGGIGLGLVEILTEESGKIADSVERGGDLDQHVVLPDDQGAGA